MVEPVRDITNLLRPQLGRSYASYAQGSDDIGVSEAAGIYPLRSVTIHQKHMGILIGIFEMIVREDYRRAFDVAVRMW